MTEASVRPRFDESFLRSRLRILNREFRRFHKSICVAKQVRAGGKRSGRRRGRLRSHPHLRAGSRAASPAPLWTRGVAAWPDSQWFVEDRKKEGRIDRKMAFRHS